MARPSALLCREVMCNGNKPCRSIADAGTSMGLFHVISSDSKDVGRLDNIASACTQ